MTSLPPCPRCNSAFTYVDGEQFVCPECGHEWRSTAAAADEEAARVVRDAVGNVLADGDTVTVIKDLKVKGSSLVVKVGTRVKNIRLVEGDHDIDCRIDLHFAYRRDESSPLLGELLACVRAYREANADDDRKPRKPTRAARRK